MMRNQDADEFFESFLISAVAAILGIRVFLHLAGYPTVGGDSLHVAHMLWGGLLMLVALLLLLGFLGKQVKSAAAFIGGIGWGTFIDELGKFLTHDNDYFFEPTFALIYVSFVLMYVAWEALHRRNLTRADKLANALELTLEAVRRDMDATERRRALALLAECDPGDPVAQSLARRIAQVELAPPGRPGLMARVRQAARSFYAWLVQRRWFATMVVAFFVFHSLQALVQAMALLNQYAASLMIVAGGLIVAGVLLHGRRYRFTRQALPAAAVVMVLALLGGLVLGRDALAGLSAFGWAELLSSVLPALVVLLGVARLRRSRLDAYRLFKAAVLTIIFVTQFFAFYRQQLLAVFGLLVNIMVLLTLRTMIHEEERLLVGGADAAQPAELSGPGTGTGPLTR
jgi:hypothetical protein